DLVAGSSITATYTDPTDPTDTSSDTIDIIASELAVTDFYAGPNPFEDEVTFAYHGTGIATTFTVAVYDLSGHVVWTAEEANVTEITWNGTNEVGAALANGAYIYMVMATDGTNTFTGKGTVFINK
ncbi:gliding motility-associated C-terminal domain-containing protein, partial [Candidatus Bipolaricaulota bacterium]|nr:gliding motility-associated C-terminal domain-containing protein [Candidatus Bipolaricaulota bacterium]